MNKIINETVGSKDSEKVGSKEEQTRNVQYFITHAQRSGAYLAWVRGLIGLIKSLQIKMDKGHHRKMIMIDLQMGSKIFFLYLFSEKTKGIVPAL